MRILAISTVSIRTQPGQKGYVLGLLCDVIDTLRSATGCVCYSTAASLTHPELIVISGYWTSLDHMEKHFENPAYHTLSELIDSKKVYGMSFHHAVFE